MRFFAAYGAILIIAGVVAIIVAIAWAITYSAQRDAECDAAGGVIVRSACIDRSVIIDLDRDDAGS